MKNVFEKFFRKLIINKYPMYLDVYIRPYIEGSLRYVNPYNRERYEVFLVINEKDYRPDSYQEVWEFVRHIAEYMGIEIMGVYNEVVNDEEWEEMKKG